MKVRALIDLIRVYPDWDVDVFAYDDATGTPLKDIKDVVADERNGSLILVMSTQPSCMTRQPFGTAKED